MHVPVTFRELKVEREKWVLERRLSASAQKNELSALKRFMKLHGVNDNSAVAPIMVSGFKEALAAYELHEERRNKVTRRSVETYVSYLRGLSATCTEMVAGLFADMGFSEALKIAMDRYLAAHPGTKPRDIAERAALPWYTLRDWSTVKSPRIDEETGARVRRLEKLFELEEGVLWSRVVDRRKTRRLLPANQGGAEPRRHLSRIAYRPKEMPPRLKEFFDLVLAYHTKSLAPTNLIGDRLIRPKKWIWRAAEDGSYPTNGIMHAAVDGIIGWLMLPATLEKARAFILESRREGEIPVSEDIATELAPLFIGKGLLPDAISPGHLVDPDIVEEFLKWQLRRNENTDAVFVIRQIRRFLSPNHGILTQQVELVADYLGFEVLSKGRSTAASYEMMTAAWHKKCAAWRADFEDLATFYQASSRVGRIRRTLAPILDHPSPMSIVSEFIGNFERARPPANATATIRLALWHRDRLLLWMLASNPLRNKNYRMMTYREDDSGNLAQDQHDRRWKIRFRPRDFKNENGAAQTPYEVDVPPGLADLITTYLKEARPRLLNNKNPCDQLFLTHRGLPFLAGNLTTLLKRLGNTFLPKVPGLAGFGTHAFRHIIATAWLKANPGEYLTVAHILHDKIDTVLKNYSHTSPKDGLDRYHLWLRDVIKPLVSSTEKADARRASTFYGEPP